MYGPAIPDNQHNRFFGLPLVCPDWVCENANVIVGWAYHSCASVTSVLGFDVSTLSGFGLEASMQQTVSQSVAANKAPRLCFGFGGGITQALLYDVSVRDGRGGMHLMGKGPLTWPGSFDPPGADARISLTSDEHLCGPAPR